MAFPAPPIRSKFSIRDYIMTLDPLADHQQICFLSTCYDFPWDYTRALELALFRCCARSASPRPRPGCGQ